MSMNLYLGKKGKEVVLRQTPTTVTKKALAHSDREQVYSVYATYCASCTDLTNPEDLKDLAEHLLEVRQAMYNGYKWSAT